MLLLTFEWDPDKDKENQSKHDVSFDEARSVFYDEHTRLIYDPDHSEEEDRFVLLGMSAKLNILTVCHSYRVDGAVIRIISARKAVSREREQYGEDYFS